MNEDMTNQETPQEKRKIKEPLTTLELKEILRGWLAAIDDETDFEFQIKGKNGKVPVRALLSNRTTGEFEFKKGEYEFELELKWKEDQETRQ